MKGRIWYVLLPAMSILMFCAAPEIADPMAKVRTKERRTGFRPNPETRSPTSGMTAVDAMVYALPGQIKSVPCRWSTMVGSAVDTAIYTPELMTNMTSNMEERYTYQVKHRK